MPGGGRVVVVVGACGGVGASTFAALLAQEAYRADLPARRRGVGRGPEPGRAARAPRPGGAGARPGGVALVDVDPAGAGVEVLLGVEGRPGVRWADLEDLRGSLAAEDLDGVLPTWRGVEVLGGDRRGGPPPPEAFRALWPALSARCRTVVVDAPPGGVTGPLADVLAGQGVDGARVVVVTGQDVRGVAAGITTLTALERVAAGRPAHLVLRRRSRARVAALEAAAVLDLPLLGLLPTDRGVAEAVDRGFGPLVGRRSALARAVAASARGCGVAPPRGRRVDA